MKTSREYREELLKQISEEIRQSNIEKGDDVLILGDFNQDVGSERM